ncbi:MAG: rod shape-determining protein MreD [Candidatus Tantalella remota]|nr:rod shape-determining protein MreD [Candidatus Tantalella remota]
MKRYLYLLVALVISVMLQVAFVGHLGWMPDLILLVVVFVGIFAGPFTGAVTGLVAGVLRGFFSPETFVVDIFLFPGLGAAAAMVSTLFYKQNPAAQIFITALGVFAVVSVHTLFLNFLSGNDVSIYFVLTGSWKPLVVTVFVSPFVFILLKEFMYPEE